MIDDLIFAVQPINTDIVLSMGEALAIDRMMAIPEWQELIRMKMNRFPFPIIFQ
jgi:hypothetical protein